MVIYSYSRFNRLARKWVNEGRDGHSALVVRYPAGVGSFHGRTRRGTRDFVGAIGLSEPRGALDCIADSVRSFIRCHDISDSFSSMFDAWTLLAPIRPVIYK